MRVVTVVGGRLLTVEAIEIGTDEDPHPLRELRGIATHVANAYAAA